MEFSAQQIADFLHGEIIGDNQVKVNNLSKIEEGKPGTLTFLANPKYTHHIYTTQASIVLVNRDFEPEQKIKATLIKVNDAYSCLAQLLNLVNQARPEKKGIDKDTCIAASATISQSVYIGAFAYVSENVKVGENVKIYPQVYIGDNVTIGDNTILYPGVKIYHDCVIGKNCIIHAGAVIGADGFGFAPHNGIYVKIAQIGNVIIEDQVEIGANTTIDRATMGSTIVRKGAKLDNLIQVAHNVEIGENTVMAAQVGVAGSTKIGSHCMVGGQVGFAGHITIGDRVNIGAQSGIPNHVSSDASILGYPAVPAREFARSTVMIKKLPELNQTVKQLQKEIENLKKQLEK
ncbi:MAG: UDP-3-O-(3-hydroxymyristoyl)glucosamine N-acyltransferase [Tannerella sp.]|uniref:UDP-3-O-(3-hydroxymyristoyl)glucosamine N-acyltransferase n=1 Tax=uncultured Coprobacter sp. TaxID=1720550 RepID=UPI00262A1AF0|nr:UDP-3-O-(3-hydroxymyristoyl)glucosamine N-acyltransferase [uncultured Coprobacter sp.]MBS6268053.1 UDP-3-O-(3-hydroxymyristoyl)glucosamine N-acyltransferase [Tannerella sp.]